MNPSGTPVIATNDPLGDFGALVLFICYGGFDGPSDELSQLISVAGATLAALSVPLGLSTETPVPSAIAQRFQYELSPEWGDQIESRVRAMMVSFQEASNGNPG